MSSEAVAADCYSFDYIGSDFSMGDAILCYRLFAIISQIGAAGVRWTWRLAQNEVQASHLHNKDMNSIENALQQ